MKILLVLALVFSMITGLPWNLGDQETWQNLNRHDTNFFGTEDFDIQRGDTIPDDISELALSELPFSLVRADTNDISELSPPLSELPFSLVRADDDYIGDTSGTASFFDDDILPSPGPI